MEKPLNNWIKRAGNYVSKRYRYLYTYMKIRTSSSNLRSNLNYKEREFYINLAHFIRDPDLVVYDIGAASGIFSSCMLKLPNVKLVHAFEPIPVAFTELCNRMKSYQNFIGHNIALGNHNGIQKLVIYKDRLDSSSFLDMTQYHKDEFPGKYLVGSEKVSVFRMDDYVLENNLQLPNFIKIDVQGYEKSVIEGGINTIRGAKFVVMEISLVQLYKDCPLFDDIYQLMKSLNFRLVSLAGSIYGKSDRQLQVDGVFQNLEKV